MGKDSPTLAQKYHYLRINITSETISLTKSSIFRKKLQREALITSFRGDLAPVFLFLPPDNEATSKVAFSSNSSYPFQ